MKRFGLPCLLCAAVALNGCAPAAAPAAMRSDPPRRTGPQVRASYERFVYAVQPGDSLYQLAQRFRVPWREIMEDNNVKPEGLKVGSLLFIRRVAGLTPPPFASPPASPPTSHAARRPLEQAALHRGQPGARYWWPTKGKVVQRFGSKLRGLADPGIAIAAPAGTDVCAVAGGTVEVVVPADDAPGSAWGNVVTVAHAGKVVSWYAHLDRTAVRAEQKVRKGQVLGSVGSTGAAHGSRLAFRLFQDERPVDPEDHLP
jgi:murein DD-endopeptidase MepM/ murein hydrolase activator NlpD